MSGHCSFETPNMAVPMKAALHIKWYSLQLRHVLFLKTADSWDVMPRQWASSSRHTEGPQCLHLYSPANCWELPVQWHCITSHLQQHCHQKHKYSKSHLCFTLDRRNCHRNCLMFGNSTTWCWFTVTAWFWFHLKPIHIQTHGCVSHIAPARTTLLSNSVKQCHSCMLKPPKSSDVNSSWNASQRSIQNMQLRVNATKFFKTLHRCYRIITLYDNQWSTLHVSLLLYYHSPANHPRTWWSK